MIAVHDNAVPSALFEKLRKVVCHESMPWYYGPTASKNDEHYSFNNDIHTGNLFELTHNVFASMSDNVLMGKEFEIIRMRYGLILREDVQRVNKPHVDQDYPHMVSLLYIDDGDGDTIFYNDDGNEYARVEPRANRCVVFDGSMKHSSSTPINKRARIALNVNFITKERE